jgi:hypothetical protein
MKKTKQIKKRIHELESSRLLQKEMENMFIDPFLVVRQVSILHELDGLYFALGKKRPRYMADNVVF